MSRNTKSRWNAVIAKSRAVQPYECLEEDGTLRTITYAEIERANQALVDDAISWIRCEPYLEPKERVEQIREIAKRNERFMRWCAVHPGARVAVDDVYTGAYITYAWYLHNHGASDERILEYECDLEARYLCE